MPLTDTALRHVKPSGKTRKMYDAEGLYLEVSPTGRTWWRLKYRYLGKEKRISLGVYPDISLSDARERRNEARKLLANHIDPSAHKKALKLSRTQEAANTFEVVSREWHTKQKTIWSKSHSKTVLRRFENDVFPWLGSRPISEITAPELLNIIRKVEKRGALESAHRLLGACGQVFRFGIATGRAERDLSADLRGALAPIVKRHFPAVTKPDDVSKLLQAIDVYQGTPIVTSALRLAPLVFVRPGELRQAKWEDIDFEKNEWSFIATKTKTEHIVPLSRQAICILTNLKPITDKSCYVFPSARGNNRPMSDNAILVALRTMGISKEVMTGHGFRAMARTMLDEVLGYDEKYIEHQLAHAVRDPNGRAYNRTTHLNERKEMMQAWADYLDELKNQDKI